MDDEDLESRGFGTSDWLKAIGGVLFFIAGLLPWWSYSFGEGGLHWDDNAFDYSLDGVLAYLIFVAIALVTIITQTGSLRLPAVFVHPRLMLVAAVVGTGLVAYRFFNGPVRQRVAGPRHVPGRRRRAARARRLRHRLSRQPARGRRTTRSSSTLRP